MTYGPQGLPVTVTAAPPTETPRADQMATVDAHGPSADPTGTPALDQSAIAAVAPDAAGDALAEGPTLAERLMVAERRLVEVTRLVTVLENRAETTLIRSDYQRGQRDATLACSNDLRAALGRP